MLGLNSLIALVFVLFVISCTNWKSRIQTFRTWCPPEIKQPWQTHHKHHWTMELDEEDGQRVVNASGTDYKKAHMTKSQVWLHVTLTKLLLCFQGKEIWAVTDSCSSISQQCACSRYLGTWKEGDLCWSTTQIQHPYTSPLWVIQPAWNVWQNRESHSGHWEKLDRNKTRSTGVRKENNLTPLSFHTALNYTVFYWALILALSDLKILKWQESLISSLAVPALITAALVIAFLNILDAKTFCKLCSGNHFVTQRNVVVLATSPWSLGNILQIPMAKGMTEWKELAWETQLSWNSSCCQPRSLLSFRSSSFHLDPSNAPFWQGQFVPSTSVYLMIVDVWRSLTFLVFPGRTKSSRAHCPTGCVLNRALGWQSALCIVREVFSSVFSLLFSYPFLTQQCKHPWHFCVINL